MTGVQTCALPIYFNNLDGAGMLEALCTDIDTDFYVLRSKELYTEDRGLTVKAERGDALFG